MFMWENCGFSDCFLRAKVYIDEWMIKIMIKTNQIDVDRRLLLSKVNHTQKSHLSIKSDFSISLLVCEFNPYRQIWLQKFTGTYPLLFVWPSLPTRSQKKLNLPNTQLEKLKPFLLDVTVLTQQLLCSRTSRPSTKTCVF